MSKSDTSENATLNAQLRGVDIPWRAGTNRWISLHVWDPGEAGTAITNEATFTGYARALVVASSWFTTPSGGSSSNTGQITYAECTAGTNTVDYVSIVDTASGAGNIIYSGPLTASRTISAGITPFFAIGSLVVTEN